MNWLGFIAQRITSLGLNYELGEFKGDPYPSTYWVGEYIGEPSQWENGEENIEFLLTGHSLAGGGFGPIEAEKELIRKHFQHGIRGILGDGTGYHIGYSNALYIPTDDESIKRIEVSLDVKLWRV